MKVRHYLYAAAALVLAGAAGTASARGDVSVQFGIATPGVAVGVSSGGYYQPAPVYYSPPPPVYYQPAPVYVRPAPIYYAPPPVYYRPAPVYFGGTYYRHPGHHHHRGHGHGHHRR